MNFLKQSIVNALIPSFAPVNSALNFIDSFGERMDYQPSVRKFLSEYGKYQITELVLERTKVNSFITKSINFLSLNQVKEAQKKYGYDKLYHLDLRFKFTDRHFRTYYYKLEKNEVIYISTFQPNPETETMPVNLNNQNITINELLDRTRHQMGDENYFKYNFEFNNCQTFILNVLSANDLLTPEYQNFIYQDIPKLFKSTNKYLKSGMNYSTRIGAKFNRLIKGKGLDANLKSSKNNFLPEKKGSKAFSSNLFEK